MAEDTQFYVYELTDPRTKKPFYVGKGKGKRTNEYFKEDSNIGRHTKIKIDEIRTDNLEIKVKIVKSNLAEIDALKLEEALIKKYGRIGKEMNGILTNVSSRGGLSRKGKDSIYATLQLHKEIHEQIVDYCCRHGFKMGRFIEMLFLSEVSGSNTTKIN